MIANPEGVVLETTETKDYEVDNAVKLLADEEKETISIIGLLRWTIVALPLLLAAALSDNFVGTYTWADVFNTKVEETACAVRGDSSPASCVTFTVPVILFVGLTLLLSYMVIRSSQARVRVVPISVACALIPVMILAAGDQSYTRIGLMRDPLEGVGCSGYPVERECQGVWEMVDGTLTKVASVGGNNENNFQGQREWTTLIDVLMPLAETGRGPFSRVHQLCLYSLTFQVFDDMEDSCTKDCDRIPSGYCRDSCEKALAGGCGYRVMKEIYDYVVETGLIQKYVGERPFASHGRVFYNKCIVDVLRDLSVSCETAPGCTDIIGTCARENLIGVVPVPYELASGVPTYDDRAERGGLDALQASPRKTLFIVLGGLLALMGAGLEVFYTKNKKMHTDGPRAWATREVRLSALKLERADWTLLIMSFFIVVALMTMSTVAAYRLEVAQNDETWTTLLAVVLTLLCVFLCIDVSITLYSWHDALARMVSETAAGYLYPSFVTQLKFMLEKLDSPSTGAWYVFYTMFGDMLELISQGSAILSKAKDTHYGDIVLHVVLLMASLLLGSVCVLCAVRLSDSNWCVAKMIVDSVADALYLGLGLGSDLLTTDVGVALGFFIPAVLLAVRTRNLIVSVLERPKASLLLRFIERHRDHPRYGANLWPANVEGQLSDTVSRVASVKGRSMVPPVFVIIIYTALVVVAAMLLKPPGDFKSNCAEEIGGPPFYEVVYPQIVTAQGLLEDPACDFSQMTEYVLRNAGLRDGDIPLNLIDQLFENNVTRLDLSGNLLTQVPVGFERLVNLEVLDLSNNQIDSLDFSRLPSSDHRDVNNNDDHLQLILDGNSIMDVANFTGQAFPGGTLPKGFGRWLHSTRKLILRDTQMVDLGEVELPRMLGVEELDLSDNPDLNVYSPMPPNVYRFNIFGTYPTGFYDFHRATKLDWNYIREQDNTFKIKWSYYQEFTLPWLKDTNGINMDYKDPSGHRPMHVFMHFHSHVDCLEFYEDCSMPQLPQYVLEHKTTMWYIFWLRDVAVQRHFTPELGASYIEFMDPVTWFYVWYLDGTSLSSLPDAFGASFDGFAEKMYDQARMGNPYILQVNSDSGRSAKGKAFFQEFCRLRFIEAFKEYGARISLAVTESADAFEAVTAALGSFTDEERALWLGSNSRIRLYSRSDLVCTSATACPKFSLPKPVSRLWLFNTHNVLEEGESAWYMPALSNVFLEVKAGARGTHLRNIYFDRVWTEDWENLGNFLGTSEKWGLHASYGVDASRLHWYNYHYYPTLGSVTPSQVASHLWNERAPEVYVPRAFFDAFMDETHAAPIGNPTYEFAPRFRANGFEISRVRGWMLKFWHLTLRQMKFVSSDALAPLFASMNMPHVYCQTLELLHVDGDLLDSFAMLPAVDPDWDNTLWDWTEEGREGLHRQKPFSLENLIISGLRQNVKESVGHIAAALADDKILANLVYLELNDMALGDTSASAILSSLAARTRNKQVVDLVFRDSEITDTFINEVTQLVNSGSFCLGTLSLDFSNGNPGSARKYSLAALADFVVASANQYCATTAVVVAAADQADFDAAVQTALGGGANSRAINMASLVDGLSTKDFLWRDFMERWYYHPESDSYRDNYYALSTDGDNVPLPYPNMVGEAPYTIRGSY